jgi:putative heme-binding domain-containing protein
MRLLLALFMLANCAIADEAKDRLFLETLARLPNIDVNANPKLKAKLDGILERKAGTAEFVNIVATYKVAGREAELLDYALSGEGDSAVTAAKLVLASDSQRFRNAIMNAATAESAMKVLGLTGVPKAVELLVTTIGDEGLALPLRSQAVTALAASRRGEKALLAASVPAALHTTAGRALATSTDPKVREQAATAFAMPASGDNSPLPALAELVATPGEPSRGMDGFSKGGCIACHQIGDQGIDFGPNLSEIGNKLSREAMFVAILDPSAGISHGFEGVVLTMRDGREGSGFVISETDDMLALRMPGGIRGEFAKADIASRSIMHSSLMPPGLQRAMSTQELIDLVTWLQTLKKAQE